MGHGELRENGWWSTGIKQRRNGGWVARKMTQFVNGSEGGSSILLLLLLFDSWVLVMCFLGRFIVAEIWFG